MTLRLPPERGALATGRIKGSAFVGIVKALRAFKEAGRKATPPALHHYLSSRILVGSWYDERDVVALMRALAKIWRPPAGIEVWEALGRAGAEEYYDSYYRQLFTAGDPLGTLRHYPAQWSLRHDTGTMTVTPLGDREARVEILGYMPAAPEYCRSVGGTIWGLVHCSGGQEVTVQKAACVCDGTGFCAWLVSWTPVA